MAAPLAKFRMKIFMSPVDLYNYIVADISDVLSITAIVTDNSGSYILYYMIA